MQTKRWWRLALVLSGFALLPLVTRSQSPAPQFSPTKAPADARYAGDQTCALCHAAHAEGHAANAMSGTLERPVESPILRNHPKLQFKLGEFSYTIERRGDESIYTVTNGRETISAPITWAFGKNVMGQTYVLNYQDRFYESRVSFYRSLGGLDLTLGASAHTPKTMEEALGRPMQSADTKECFGCHALAAVSGSKLQLDKMTPGVRCESCHGPGADHVALAKANKAKEAKDKLIFNPASLSPYDLSQQFCGACHRSWEEVQMTGLRGVGNVRFQPYRIVYSPCYNPEDRRITCTACHNPHEAPKRDALSYDAKCTACHALKTDKTPTKQQTAKVCKVGTQKCASCHMPEYEIPGSHFKFTDHMIRVVKPGEAYPN